MFKTQNFCHVASNNRNNVKAGIFVYRTTDDLATVITSGYFNQRIIDINLHDLIIHEKIDPTDNTKVQRNLLCVVEKTLENVGTSIIKSKWEGDIEQAIADLQEYVDNTFVRKDGTSVMTGPLLMRATDDFKCAIAPYWDGIGFFKLNDNNSVTLMASLEYEDGLTPATDNTYNLGTATKRWKDARIARVITATINNGYDIAVPVTNSADTLALKSQVDLAANSGSQLYTTGVWYAKMYSASTVPTGAEYDGRNYADFSQTDSGGNPVIKIYTGASGAWTLTETITPPATYNGYITVTSKIWDIAEQTDQQGGEVLWSYNQKTFTPYPKIVNLLNQANTDLSNLTSTGKNIANWSSNVTNCITEIPQDIKLELNNGTLTVKSGSKVYVPNGFEQDGVTPKYEEVIKQFNSDITAGIYADGTYMLFIDESQAPQQGLVSVCSSGATQPSGGQDNYWYDTLNNMLKRYNAGMWVVGHSFPICIFTISGGTITSIDQVFNGFGYIGRTHFVLPGVKGLSPNGFNEDGTLKNNEVTIGTVQTSTVISEGWSGLCFFNNSYNIIYSESLDRIKYLPEENKLINTLNNTYLDGMVFFAIVQNVDAKVQNYIPKAVFHAVDYNDFEPVKDHSVVEFQAPTAANNYTWYRKYRDGWVEQGGITDSLTVNLPVTMSDTNYCVQITGGAITAQNNVTLWGVLSKTTSSFDTQGNTVNGYNQTAPNTTGTKIWYVCGMAA